MDQSSQDARLAEVEKHVQHENQHDLDGIMETFGEDAWYDVEPLDEHHDGRQGVRSYYEDLLRALPDLTIDVHKRHATNEHVILEVTMSGTHTGEWRGLPGTGNKLVFKVCSVFAFDDQDKIAGERIYYDRASILRQLGIFHDPESRIGRILTPMTHPLTMIKALIKGIRNR
ncbi:MAG: ester cyclase [Candidatus Halalkalibacterium sp. M3_1C_030]